MAEQTKAAEILATYKELQGSAQDVSPDLLFNTAVNLACPWHWMGTATGVGAMRAAVEREPMRPETEFVNNAADASAAARAAAAEIEAGQEKAVSA